MDSVSQRTFMTDNLAKQLKLVPEYKELLSVSTVPLDLNFTYARAQKATARNIHGNAPE